MTLPLIRQWRMLALAASLVGVSGVAHAEDVLILTPGGVGSYLNQKMFGDYGPVSVITGKPTPRYVNGKRVVPKEGWLSSSMRDMTNKLHRRDGAQAGRGGQTQQFTRLTTQNLALDVPNGEWEQRPPQWKDNGIALYRRNPDLGVLIAANRVGIEAKQTSHSLLAASQEMTRKLPNAEVLPGVGELSAPGLAGLTYQAKVTRDNGQEILCSVWLAAKNGYTYEMTVSGEIANGREVESTMEEFVSRMREKDPNRVAHAKKPNKWKFWK